MSIFDLDAEKLKEVNFDPRYIVNRLPSVGGAIRGLNTERPYLSMAEALNYMRFWTWAIAHSFARHEKDIPSEVWENIMRERMYYINRARRR